MSPYSRIEFVLRRPGFSFESRLLLQDFLPLPVCRFLSHRGFPHDSSGSLPSLGRPAFRAGGDDGIRTHDPLLAGQVLSQLSYTPVFLYPSSLSFKRASESSLKIEQQSDAKTS